MSAVRVCYGHLVVAMILSSAQKRDDLLLNMHLYDCTCLPGIIAHLVALLVF